MGKQHGPIKKRKRRKRWIERKKQQLKGEIKTNKKIVKKPESKSD